MHSDYSNILKTVFSWMAINAAFKWQTGGAEKNENGSLKFFGTINGRDFYKGKEQLSWIDSMRSCIEEGGRLKLLDFDTDDQVSDFMSLLPFMKATHEGGIKIWTAGLSSKNDNDILWSGRDVYASSTNLTGEKYHLADTIGGGGCIMITAVQRPSKKTPLARFKNASCETKADYICFSSQESDQNGAHSMLQDGETDQSLRDNTLQTGEAGAGSHLRGNSNSQLQGSKRDPCLIKNPPHIDLWKEEGLSTEEMLLLVKLRHDHAFHTALDDNIGSIIDESDFDALTIKESIIDLFFKILKRIFPDKYDQYAYFNIARRVIFLYLKWNNKGFPGELDKGKWKKYREDLIACFNVLTPLTYRFSHQKIIYVGGHSANLNGIEIFPENDIFLETLWFSFSTVLGACTTSVNHTQQIFWMKQFFLDFDLDFLSGFKDMWSAGIVESGDSESSEMELANQILFGDMNYVVMRNNLALLSKATHKLNELDRLMIVRPL